jgi:hypothetical protein
MTRATIGRKVAARELRRLDGILDELQRHLDQGGTLDDPCVVDLYQDYYGLRRDEPINLPAVRTWAARHAKPIAYSNQDIDREQARMLAETRVKTGW